MLLIAVLAAGFSYAQDAVSETEQGPVDETSLILFPDDQDAESQAVELPEESIAPASVGVGDLVRVLFVLAAVIGVIYLLVYFLKRFSPLAENEEEQISVLATRHIKKDSSLHLVEVGNQVFLIGSGTNNVSLISEITDQETLDKLHLEFPGKRAPAGNSFRQLIRRNFSRQTFKGLSEGSPEFLRQQRDRLRHLREEE